MRTATEVLSARVIIAEVWRRYLKEERMETAEVWRNLQQAIVACWRRKSEHPTRGSQELFDAVNDLYAVTAQRHFKGRI